MAKYTWQGGGGNTDWGTAANWLLNGTTSTTIPSSASDEADFTGTATYTVTTTNGTTYTAGTIVLSDANATLDVLGNLQIGTTTVPGTLTITAGTLIIDSVGGTGSTPGRLRNGTVVDSGGTVTFNGGTLQSITWQGTLDLSAAGAFAKAGLQGTASSASDGTVTLTLLNAAGTGNGTMLLTGNGAKFGFLDYQTFNNATIQIGSTGGSASVLFVNEGNSNSTGAAQVTFGSGVQVTQATAGSKAAINSTNATDVLINQGTIAASASGGTMTIGATLTNQGTLQVQNGEGVTITGTTTNAAAGVITVDSSSTLSIAGTLIDQGGSITGTSPSNIFVQSAGNLTGFGTITSAIADSGVITANGGTLNITSVVSGAGTMVVSANSKLVVGGSVTVSNVIYASSGTSETFGVGTLTNSATITGLIAGDTLWLTGVDDSQGDVLATYNAGTLSVTRNGTPITTFTLGTAYTGTPQFFATADANGGTDITTTAACYAHGTRIAVPGGDAAIETLAIGDRVVTRLGGVQPIHWIGRRAYAGRFAAANPEVWPVRIRAGALGPGVPQRDLRVSPRHAMLIDGVLVPAELLVNGTSIVKEGPGDVAYIHLEFAAHDAVLAEGAWSESFLDDDSRGLFHNAAEYARLYPGPEHRERRFCAPRIEGGPELAALRARLASATPATAPLRGHLDEASAGLVRGWAQNPARPDVPVCLEVLVDGMPAGLVLADRFRADLRTAGLGTGRHGFQLMVPGLGAGQRVVVRRAADGAVLEARTVREAAA